MLHPRPRTLLKLVGSTAGLVLLAAACATSGGSTTLGGAVPLGEVVAGEPFYDATTGQPLIDARLVSAVPLEAFDVPDDPGEVVDGTVQPVGQLGEVQVATWRSDHPEPGMVDCFGFIVDGGAGADCGEEGGPTEAEVHFQVTCPSDGEPEWLAFTIDETVDALRMELADDQSLVGDDPGGTGLVAVEATGAVTRVTAQTAIGEVRLVEAVAECPPG